VDRRAFIGTLTGGLLAAPLNTVAQPAAALHRIGYLSPGFFPTENGPSGPLDAFRARLAELGYQEGRTFKLDLRFAEGDAERLPRLAVEVVEHRPSIIVTIGSAATLAAKAATTTIPIVMALSLDPVREGLVRSLARPGGNVTGLTVTSDAALIGKRLQLVKELIRGAKHLALVPAPRPRSQVGEHWLRDAKAAARSTGFTIQVLEVQDQTRWDQVFATATRDRAELVYFVEWGPYIARARQIAEQAVRSRMPTLFGARPHVEAGGLLSYGTDSRELARRAAEYADKILKGAKPGDLPIEQPEKFELVINLKTAKALGLTIPSSLLQRADQVIE
jgi:putative ABC transport system substrate-binding protein